MLSDLQRQLPATDDPRVTSLLNAASAPPSPGVVEGEQQALQAFRTAHTSPRSRRPTSIVRLKPGVAAALATGMLLTGGVTAAATGSLPEAAQNTAREWFGKVGVVVPAAEEGSAGQSNGADHGGELPAAPVQPPFDFVDRAPVPPPSTAHGTALTEPPKDPDLTGRGKDDRVSEAMPDGGDGVRGGATGTSPSTPQSSRRHDSHATADVPSTTPQPPATQPDPSSQDGGVEAPAETFREATPGQETVPPADAAKTGPDTSGDAGSPDVPGDRSPMSQGERP
jgi:hypothetical protein